MNQPPIEPTKYVSGSAFNGNTVQANRPINAIAGRDRTNYISLTAWCAGNFLTKYVGYELIKRQLLIGQRLYGQWWVCANPDCLDQLLEYIGLEQLNIDADNNLRP